MPPSAHLHRWDEIALEKVTEMISRKIVGGERMTVREGEVVHIPSLLPHQAEALDDTLELDVFSPPRQEWTPPAPE